VMCTENYAQGILKGQSGALDWAGGFKEQGHWTQLNPAGEAWP